VVPYTGGEIAVESTSGGMGTGMEVEGLEKGWTACRVCTLHNEPGVTICEGCYNAL
jgi:hypothetical protein